MTSIPGDPDVWYVFNEDRWSKEGHHGKWWGRLVRQNRTRWGSDQHLKSIFRLSDGQDVTVFLSDEEFCDDPKSHGGVCEPGDLCDDELRHLGLDNLIKTGRGRSRGKAKKVASANPAPAQQAVTGKRTRGQQDKTPNQWATLRPGSHLARNPNAKVRKTRGAPSKHGRGPSRQVRGESPGGDGSPAPETGGDGQQDNNSDTDSDKNAPMEDTPAVNEPPLPEANMSALPNAATETDVPGGEPPVAVADNVPTTGVSPEAPDIPADPPVAPGLVELPREQPVDPVPSSPQPGQSGGDNDTPATPGNLEQTAMSFLTSPVPPAEQQLTGTPLPVGVHAVKLTYWLFAAQVTHPTALRKGTRHRGKFRRSRNHLPPEDAGDLRVRRTSLLQTVRLADIRKSQYIGLVRCGR